MVIERSQNNIFYNLTLTPPSLSDKSAKLQFIMIH